MGLDVGFHNKQWITKTDKAMGGNPFSKTAVYRLLNDPLYLGKTRHKDQLYEGEHEAIIAQEVWGQTQKLLQKKSVHKSRLKTESGTI